MSTSMREVLEWYAEQTEGCRKLGSIGDPARKALNDDGGKRARAALSSPAPDRLSEEERATIEIARTVATKLSETQANVFPVECNVMMQSGHRTVAALLAIIDRLVEPLYTSPRLYRARAERIASEIVEKLNCDWGFNKNPTRDEAKATIADAIMRETR